MNGQRTVAPLVNQAAAALRSGRLVAFPTETVYGLGADARNLDAVAQIFAVKGRPADHPLIVHLADAAQLTDWAQEVPEAAWQLAKAFWPGPLTLILPRRSGVPDAVTGGLDTVALRVPNHPVALALLTAFGGGIAAPSANRYGRVSPTTAEHVREELGTQVEMVLDGGPCFVGIESTIVDATKASSLCILRPGAITTEALRRVLGTALRPAGQDALRSPGRKLSHYAPCARVVLVSQDDAAHEAARWLDQGLRVGLLSARRPAGLPESVMCLHLPESLMQQARALYQGLRQADHLNVQVLLAVLPADTGIGHAIRDRLLRAAGLGDDGSSHFQVIGSAR